MYLEGGDLLRITESELLRFGLCIGLDIDDRTVVELQQSGARSETRVRAANMISSRPLSKKELSKKLREKGSVEADAESACDWLEEIGALNDAEYAAMLVRHYGGMGYGEAKIRDELYRRGVPRELWEDALSKLPDAQEAIARVIAQKTKGRVLDERAQATVRHAAAAGLCMVRCARGNRPNQRKCDGIRLRRVVVWLFFTISLRSGGVLCPITFLSFPWAAPKIRSTASR